MRRARRRPTGRSGGWWAGLIGVPLAIVVLLAGIVVHLQRSNGGRPLPWQAFYDPREAYVLVWPTAGRCGSQTKVSETKDSVMISVRQSPVQPGHGTCVSPLANESFQLRSPVGTRRVVSADGAGLGTAFRLTDRLHARFSGVTSLPVVSTAVRDAGGWRWTLFYAQPSATEAFTLTSTAVGVASSRSGELVVRAGHNALPCADVLCWTEGGYAYTVSSGPLGGVRPLTVEQAVAFADGLVLAQ